MPPTTPQRHALTEKEIRSAIESAISTTAVYDVAGVAADALTELCADQPDVQYRLPDDVLATLIDAARKWSDELDEYIIPSAQDTSDEDAAVYQEQMAKIERAINIAEQALTAPAVRPQVMQPESTDLEGADDRAGLRPAFAVLNIPCTAVLATTETREQAEAVVAQNSGSFAYALSEPEIDALMVLRDESPTLNNDEEGGGRTMKSPAQIADSLGIDWESEYTPSRDDIVRAIKIDRAQIRAALAQPQAVAGFRRFPLATVDALIDAYEAFESDPFDSDLARFIDAWNDYTAGLDFPCPEHPAGLHQVTDGSCDCCGDKNRG